MAQLIVHNLDDDLRDKLQHLAQSHGRSMEAEVRSILSNAVKGQTLPRPSLGSRLVQRFAPNGLDADIPELRGQSIEPLSFGS